MVQEMELVMAREKIFVFVVCGGIEHLETLHYSLAALRKYSRCKIIVLTDSSRNEIPVAHDNIVDIKTPDSFTHHQASIYLKTALHRFLPKGNLYCYLDADVVALHEQVDAVFDEYLPPITFAPDHCVANQFSLSAMRCGCSEKYRAWEKELKSLFLKYKDLSRPPENLEKKERLLKKLDALKKNKLHHSWISLRYNMSRAIFKLDNDNFLDKRTRIWTDKNGQTVLYEKNVKSSLEMIESTTPYRIEKEQGKKWLRDGLDVFDARCTHLHEAILKEFGIAVNEQDWQHWNGGVFLFDERSAEFLDSWHEKTMRIFKLPEWRIRDQGTLMATAWQFGLQQHKTIPTRFNLIADYEHQQIKHLGDLAFEVERNKHKEIIQPAFIHIYHHWADKKWDVWQAVEKNTGILTDADASTINSLWIGNELSKLELLTIHSFLKHGYRFRLWLYEPLQTSLPEAVIVADAHTIIPREKVFRYKNKSQFGHGKGSVAGFSDIFRYKLLYDKGGWWVDMDITCLKPLDIDEPYFFRKHHELNVVGNVLKCPRGCELMKRCYEEASSAVDEHNTDWHKPIDILNKNISDLQLQPYIVNHISNQDRWDDTSRFVYGEQPVPPEWYFIHWQNEEWRNQALSKKDFYFKSALAKQLSAYGLYEPPKSKFAELRNTLSFLPLSRKIRRRFLD